VVVLGRRAADGSAELIFRDSGIGMRAEDIPRALEPFQQVDGSYTRQMPGTGLGLPIAKGLTEAHGGRLEIESIPGAGTTVRVVLPATSTRIGEG
jgi:signal transduction histidine kinase